MRHLQPSQQIHGHFTETIKEGDPKVLLTSKDGERDEMYRICHRKIKICHIKKMHRICHIK